MRFWFSGEIHHSVGERYRLVRNTIEVRLNRLAADAAISPALDEIAYFAIMLPTGWGEDYPEVTRHAKKERTLECRLKVDCDAFARTDEPGCFDLLEASLARVPDIANQKKILFDRNAYLQILRGAIDDAKKG